MTTARVTTIVMHAASLVGVALFLTGPTVVAQLGDTVEVTRTIDVTLSRFTFSPERIEVHLGEHVRFRLTARDGAHGFQIKELGLNARVLVPGQTVSTELTPTRAGTFQITCSEYCGSGHSRMKAWLIVTPGS